MDDSQSQLQYTACGGTVGREQRINDQSIANVMFTIKQSVYIRIPTVAYQSK